MRSIFISAIILIVSCNPNTESKIEKSKKAISTETTLTAHKKSDLASPEKIRKLTFLDSVSAKMDLTIGQIHANTRLDSVFFTGINSNVALRGDTAYENAGGFKTAVISYDDKRNCIYKFMFVWNETEKRNTDYKLIYSICDRDWSANYSTLRYFILNDSVFETIEADYSPNAARGRAKKTRWKRSEKGIIVPIPIINP